jgi:hypothetical protein
MISESLYRRAITRNLYELRWAISEGIAAEKFHDEVPKSWWSFFTFCHIALNNDCLSHLIKVLDKNKDSVSFWHIYDYAKNEIDKIILERSIKFDEIQEISEKVKKIRDKTHFHIDKKVVFDPDGYWRYVKINGMLVKKVLNYLWEILNILYKKENGNEFGQRLYDGDDIKSIVEAVKKSRIII